jgi:Bacterial membrane protein YfhO
MYILMRWLFSSEKRLPSFFKLSVAGILAIACFSIYLFPTAEYFLNGINLNYREGYGVSQLLWRSLFNLFFANIYGFPLTEAARWKYGSYVNVAIFVGFLAPVSFLSGALLRVFFKRDFHIFFFIGSSLFLLCAIYDFPFESLEQYINRLPLFHGNPPAHQATFLQLFIFISGALGLQYLWDTDFRKKHGQKIFAIVAAGACSAAAIFEFNTLMSEGTPSAQLNTYFYWSLVLAGLFLIFFLLIILKPAFIKRYQVIFFFILGIMFVTEARLHSTGWVPSMKPEFWFPETAATNFLKSHIAEGRVMPLDRAAVPETLSQYGFPVAVGRGSVPRPLMHLLFEVFPEAYRHPTQTLFPLAETNLGHKLWDLLDVRFFVASRNIDLAKIERYGDSLKVHRLNDSTILERSKSPQHAFFATDGVVIDKLDEIALFFRDSNWDIRRQIALEKDSDLLPGDSRQLENTASAINVVPKVVQGTNSVTVDITTDRPGYLILSQYYYPGWNAYVNGKKVDIFRAYYFLSAIHLAEPGVKQIEFRYEPSSLYYGALISLLGVILSAVIYGTCIWKERKANTR